MLSVIIVSHPQVAQLEERRSGGFDLFGNVGLADWQLNYMDGVVIIEVVCFTLICLLD